MAKVKILKLKALILTKLAKLTREFNCKIKGIDTIYNLNYAGDNKNRHTADIMHPNGSKGLPIVLYMHGGGWCTYDKSVFRSTCKQLANCGAVVFNCNYSLTPEYTIEDIFEDVNKAFAFIKKQGASYGGNPDKIILAGDSAGAHILSLFINKATAEENKFITDSVKGCAFFYGAYDLDSIRYTTFKYTNAYLSTLVPIETPDYEKRLKELSPIYYVVKELPPIFICGGKVDTLNESQTEKYIQVLKEKGVVVHSLIFPEDCKDAKHKFITFINNPAAIKAFEAFYEFLKTI